MIHHFNVKIKFQNSSSFSTTLRNCEGNVIRAIATEIQEEIYDNEGQDGYFHVAHAEISGDKVKAVLIMQVDDSTYEEGDIPASKALEISFRTAYEDSMKFKISRIQQFNVAS